MECRAHERIVADPSQPPLDPIASSHRLLARNQSIALSERLRMTWPDRGLALGMAHDSEHACMSVDHSGTACRGPQGGYALARDMHRHETKSPSTDWHVAHFASPSGEDRPGLKTLFYPTMIATLSQAGTTARSNSRLTQAVRAQN